MQSDAVVKTRIKLGEHQFPPTCLSFVHFLKLLQLGTVNASDFSQVSGDTGFLLDEPDLFKLHASEALFEVNELFNFIQVAVALHFLLLVLSDALQLDGFGICCSVEFLLGTFNLFGKCHNLDM